jgi:hypothetical protein
LGNVLNNHQLAKRFLLGNLSESERVEIEDAFLTQDDSYQELLVAEDELIDAYVRGELPAPDRLLFEQRCLSSPHSRERVEFARTLFDSVSGNVVPARAPERPASWWRSLAGDFVVRRPALGFAFAAALFVIVLGGLWFVMDKWRTRPAPEQARGMQPAPVTPLESPAPIRPAEEPHLARLEERPPVRETPGRPSPVPAPVIATFTLLSGLARGGNGAGPLVLPVGATEVRLRLTWEGDPYKQYRAVLSSPEGRRISSRDVTTGPATRSADLTLSFPADLFNSGDYVLDLSGAKAPGKWESVADYSFRIIRK